MDVRRSYAPPSVIKSIQSGIVSMTTSPTNVTVAAVNMAKSIVIPAGKTYGGAALNDSNAIGRLTTGTNVQFTRANNSNALDVAYQVVEYW